MSVKLAATSGALFLVPPPPPLLSTLSIYLVQALKEHSSVRPLSRMNPLATVSSKQLLLIVKRLHRLSLGVSRFLLSPACLVLFSRETKPGNPIGL